MDDSTIKKLYEFVLDEDWEGMKEYLSEYKKEKSEDKEMMLLRPISVHRDTIIHLAVHSKKEEPLKQILECVNPDMVLSFLTEVNAYGNTVLHEAAISKNLEAVKLLVGKATELIRMKNDAGETPLFRAASFGNTKIVKFLAHCQKDQWVTTYEGNWQLQDIHRRNNKGASIVRAAVQGKNFGTALELLKMDKKLADLEDKYGSSLSYIITKLSSVFKIEQRIPIWAKIFYHCMPIGCGYNDEVDNIETNDDDNDDDVKKDGLFFKGLASGSGHYQGTDNIETAEDMKDSYVYLSNLLEFIGSVSYWIYLSIWRLIIAGSPKVREIWKKKRDRVFVRKVALILISKDKSMNQSNMPLPLYDRSLEVENKEKEEEKVEDEEREIPLFSAIKKGNVACVKYILTNYPQAFELVNCKKQNILQVAIMYRQKKIFNLVRERKIPMLRLARQIDVNGYTILHSAADTKYLNQATNAKDHALQLRKELEWFNRVEKLVPNYYAMRHAHSNKMTASQVFKRMHEEQHKKAQKWTKDFCRANFANAVLVSFFVFAAAFTTVDGTIVDSNGLSNLLYKPIFLFLTVTDIISLICSLAAASIFLIVLASPLTFNSFLSWVRIRLSLSSALFFMSVATNMLTFTWTMFHIMIRLEDHGRSRMNLACHTASFVVSILAWTYFPLFEEFRKFWIIIFRYIKCILPGDSVIGFRKFLKKSVRRYLHSKDKKK